jgi:hypothetical protein
MELTSLWDRKTRTHLRQIIEKIRDKGLGVSQEDLYSFLWTIQGADSQIIRYCTNRFYEEQLYLSKPIAYLKGMIVNFDKNKEKLQEIEYKIHGKKPPIKEV